MIMMNCAKRDSRCPRVAKDSKTGIKDTRVEIPSLIAVVRLTGTGVQRYHYGF